MTNSTSGPSTLNPPPNHPHSIMFLKKFHSHCEVNTEDSCEFYLEGGLLGGDQLGQRSEKILVAL